MKKIKDKLLDCSWIEEDKENDILNQIIFRKNENKQIFKRNKQYKTVGFFEGNDEDDNENQQMRQPSKSVFGTVPSRTISFQGPKQLQKISEVRESEEQIGIQQKDSSSKSKSVIDLESDYGDRERLEQLQLTSQFNKQQQKQQVGNSSKVSMRGVTYIRERYFEYKYRWVVVVVFLLSCLVQALSINAFTPIGPSIQKLYNKSTNLVTLPSLIFMLISPPTMLPVNYISDKYGIRIGTMIGGFMIIVGTALKCLININYYFTVVGSLLCGIGNSFICNCPTKVASNWFKPSNRTLISIIFTLSLMISPTIGFLIPPFFVSSTNPTKNDVFNLLLFEFVASFLILGSMIIFFRESPPSPPSYIAQRKKLPFGPQLKQLFTNKQYYLLLVTMGFNVGGFSGFTTVSSFYLEPFGYGPKQLVILILLATIFGIVCSLLSGIYVRMTRKLKKTIIISVIAVVIIFSSIQVFLWFDFPVWIVLGMYGLLGATYTPTTPAVVELAAETCYPVAESTSTGFLFAASQIVGFTVGTIASSVVDGDSKKTTNIGFIILLCVFIIPVITILFAKQDFKRTREEIKKSIVLDKKITQLNRQEITEINEQLIQEGVL